MTKAEITSTACVHFPTTDCSAELVVEPEEAAANLALAALAEVVLFLIVETIVGELTWVEVMEAFAVVVTLVDVVSAKAAALIEKG